MARKRMFSKDVVGSARFLRMKPAARLLYYDLGMQADDDGFVEALVVLRTTEAKEKTLRDLADSGFVRILDNNLVTHIVDWRTNNDIKKDRHKASPYAQLLDSLETERNQVGDKLDTQIREGEIRREKDRGESMAPPAAEPAPAKVVRDAFGRYGWVRLSKEEYGRLLNDLGKAEFERCIAYVDESAQSTGNKNHWRDWNLVLRRCHRDGWGLSKEVKDQKKGYEWNPGDNTGSL